MNALASLAPKFGRDLSRHIVPIMKKVIAAMTGMHEGQQLSAEEKAADDGTLVRLWTCGANWFSWSPLLTKANSSREGEQMAPDENAAADGSLVGSARSHEVVLPVQRVFSNLALVRAFRTSRSRCAG